MATNSSEILSALSSALSSSNVTSGGSSTFVSGQNSYRLPSQLEDSNYYKGINVTTKGGFLSPRAGYVEQKFTLDNGEDYFEDTNGIRKRYKDIFDKGRFQGACKYYTEIGERIVCVYSGIIFILNSKTRTGQAIEIDKEYNKYRQLGTSYEPITQRINQYKRRVNFSQAGKYLVIFDYPDRPIIIDGYHAFRSPVGKKDTLGDPEYYVPATVLGCYNSNRLFVANATNEFTCGDPVGSLSEPQAPITFNEVYQEAAEYLGQVFSLGDTNKNNTITAMGFLQSLDTSTGIGPLFVATKDCIYSYITNTARSGWTTSDTAFGTMILYNAGIIGSKSFDNLNSDLVFMSGDGHIRILTVSKEYTSSWENIPVDLEVWNWLKTDLQDLSDLTVVKCFDNKVFITAQPIRTEATDLSGNPTKDYAFKGLVVLELDSLATFNSKSNPAWAGIWTGLNIMDMVESNNELFLFTKDPTFKNKIYTLDTNLSYDVYNDEKKPIKCRIYTKQYGLESLFGDKRERTVILGLQGLQGKVTLDVSRSNDYKEFMLWKHWEYEAPVCTTDYPMSLKEHNFREFNLGSPEEVGCDPVTKDDVELYRGVQFRIDISADYWRLESIIVVSDSVESSFDETICELESGVKINLDCDTISDLNLYHTANYVED